MQKFSAILTFKSLRLSPNPGKRAPSRALSDRGDFKVSYGRSKWLAGHPIGCSSWLKGGTDGVQASSWLDRNHFGSRSGQGKAGEGSAVQGNAEQGNAG